MGIYWRNGWAWGRKTIKRQEYRGPLGTQSKRDAPAAYQKWLAELQESLKATPRGDLVTTWRAAVDNFTTNHFPTLEPSSQDRYLLSLLILNPHFENTTLQAIGKADIGRFVTARRRAGKQSKYKGKKTTLEDSTIVRDLQCMSSVFTVAIDFDLCEQNPAAAYLKAHKRRKTLVNSDARRRYLSHTEEERVLTAAIARAMDPTAIRRFEKFMIACAIALYIDLGFRAQELLSARRNWVDFERNEITIPKEFCKNGEARTVPLLPRARRIIEMLPTNKHTDLLLWRTAAGKKFADLNKTFQTIARAAGVHDVEIHDLRRTCGCRLLQDHRLKMAEVSRWLGHASVDITEKAYAFLKSENLHDAVGGRVIDLAARQRLAEMLNAEIRDFIGTKAGTKEITAIENKRQIG